MVHPQNKSPSLQDHLRELTDEVEKKKVRLTPEVQTYIQEHLDVVQEKLVKREPVYEADMAFIEEVKMWVRMPEEWRDKYPSIEEMNGAENVQEAHVESKKRHISIQQWLDLLHVAEASEHEKEWIDKQFNFSGGGKVVSEGDLYLNGCTSLISLPEGLSVGGILNLTGCTSLTSLPEGLSVRGHLNLEGCTSLTLLPEGLSVDGVLFLNSCTSLTSLPEGLSVGEDLGLRGCTSLTSLPEGLSVDGTLLLSGCTSLTSLPEGLSVWRTLLLSKNLNDQVKKDAERLKEEGKIKGKILYQDV